MSREQLDKFLRLLKVSPSGAVFNPWWQIDDGNDFGSHSPRHSQKTFSRLFCERLGKARLAIVGEALGYRGGHFSGIPMTSERMLLSKQRVLSQVLSHVARANRAFSRRFFGNDGDYRLGHIAKEWHAAERVRFLECVSVAFIRSVSRAVEQSYA